MSSLYKEDLRIDWFLHRPYTAMESITQDGYYEIKLSRERFHFMK